MALADRQSTHDPLDELLHDLVEDGRVVHLEHLPARAARYGQLDRPLPEVVRRVVDHPLWAHQAVAIDALRSGHDVVIATGTASGKSLCYQLPIAEAVTSPLRPSTALGLFPTKALAHDQLRAVTELGVPGLTAATYDGDTTREARALVRTTANVIFTNPEMLHAGLLPHHKRWAEFFMRLRYVVVDELHVLRGVFGSHVAHLLRRLLRIAHHYGGDPRLVFCSATIGQPELLASQLTGRPAVPVVDDASPRGPRVFALLNPPVVGDRGQRTSANSETAATAARLVDAGFRTIAFCRSRKGTELVAADISRRVARPNRNRIRAYRSGYLAEERRTIEEELAAGTVAAVVATSALELGVDIGGLDATVMNGFPGTIASMWQQAGRAGRDDRRSVSVLVAGDDQLDQWLMQHPAEVFARPPERAVINPTNPFIRDPHLACAAFELPLTHADERYWGDDLHDGVRDLTRDDRLRVARRGRRVAAYWSGHGFPARSVGLRSGGRGEFRIEDRSGDLIGTVDESRACAVLHPGAVYLHRGRSFEVAELHLDERRAVVDDHDGTEYTQTRRETSISILEVEQRREHAGFVLACGTVDVSNQVIGFQRREVRSRKILTNEPLELPPSRLVTRSFWYEIGPELVAAARVTDEALPGALHAAEHGLIGMLPLFTICDRWDVGGVSTAYHADTGRPTIFVHEAVPGGTGISELGFEASPSHLAATREAIEWCGCDQGCPSCVQSPKCGNGNEPLHKSGAVALLAALSAANLPDQSSSRIVADARTVNDGSRLPTSGTSVGSTLLTDTVTVSSPRRT